MFDIKILLDRKIIHESQDFNAFLENISFKIFGSDETSVIFSNLLKQGYVAFSTSVYNDLKNPESAIALRLDETKTTFKNYRFLEKYIKNGVGVGINFSNFKNPTKEIFEINNYFKNQEPFLNRPPAGIALLNVTHSKIMEFISLKDDANYDDWCFNNSVVIDENFILKVDNDEDLVLDNVVKIQARKIYNQLLSSMLKKGEPGIFFSNDKNFLCDCCAASHLKENETLTIAQINLSKFYDKNFDFDYLSKSAKILSIALSKIAKNGFVSVLGYQDLLNLMGLSYGSDKAIDILERALKIIKVEANKNNIRTCISPSGVTSRILKTTPSIEPSNNDKITYFDELKTMKIAQKYLDGGISKTILLKKHHTTKDIDLIIRYAIQNNLKGITVFSIR